MYDTIIVGGRCAGAATALLLARRGQRILLLERSGIPSDTLSTHVIWQSGASRLVEWGLGDRLAASCPPLRHVTLDAGDVQLTGTAPAATHSADYYCCRRTALDHMLVDAAIAAGAEFRPEFTVEDVLWEDETVIGVVGHARGKARVADQARLVIGADGLHSVVARRVGAAKYAEHPPQSCCYYSYFSGVDIDHGWLCPRDGIAVGAMPTGEGLTMAVVQAGHREADRFRAATEESFWAAMDRAPSIAQPLRAGRREDRFHGTADLPNFLRVPAGPGWVLVGDAGYHKDPITAQGISDAFCQAGLIVELLGPALPAPNGVGPALSTYQALRDERAMPMYELTVGRAALRPPPPELAGLFSALQDNPGQTDRFFGVLAGTVAVGDFYSPENMTEILARVGPATK